MSFVPLGIDISKSKFDVAIELNGKMRHKAFRNDPSGFAALDEWIKALHIDKVHACMEATGAYGDALAYFLHEQGHMVSIVNPAQIKAFGQSSLSRNKTDKADAALITRFCQKQNPPAWSPPPPEVQQLKRLVRRLEEVKAMLQQESNRIQEPGLTAEEAASLTSHISFLEKESARLLDLISQQIDQHPNLCQQRDLLVSIPGVGDLTAAKLIAEVPDIHAFKSARQLAAYAGLTPMNHQSGSSVRGRTRLSKVGHARLRKALYMPAIAAMRCNPVIRAFCQRLRANDPRKSGKSFVAAAMRKLLHIVFGVLKSSRPFDPQLALGA